MRGSNFVSVERTPGKPASEGEEGNSIGISAIKGVGGKYLLVMSFVMTAIALFFYRDRLKEIAIGWLVIGAIILAMKAKMIWQHHTLDIQARRNDISVVLRSEQGGILLTRDRAPAWRVLFGKWRLPIHSVLPDPSIPIEPIGISFIAPPAVTVREVSEPTVDDALNYTQRHDMLTPGKDMEADEWIGLGNLTSIGIGGVTGSGKTNTTSLLVLEMKALARERSMKLLVFDPHGGADSTDALSQKIAPLNSWFIDDPVRDEKGMIHWTAKFWDEVRLRADGVRPKNDVWVLIWDEFASAMTNENLAGMVAPMLERINGEGRKLHMYTILNSREWKKDRVGGEKYGTLIRRSIPTFLVHRMAQDIVGTVIPGSEASQRVPFLEDGELGIYAGGRVRWVRAPLVQQSDMSRFVNGTAIEGSYREVPQILPGGMTNQQVVDVRSLMLQGRNMSEIAQGVFGSASAANQKKVADAIRIALGQDREAPNGSDSYSA